MLFELLVCEAVGTVNELLTPAVPDAGGDAFHAAFC